MKQLGMAKNHYVSQLIIKRFAPSVSTFDMQTNQIVEHRQAAKIFFDRDIYDNDIEEKMAHDLEQPFASILDKKILNCDKIRLTRNELYLVKQFLLMDSVRTYTPEHFQRVIKNFHSNTHRYLKVNHDFFDESVKALPSTEYAQVVSQFRPSGQADKLNKGGANKCSELTSRRSSRERRSMASEREWLPLTAETSSREDVQRAERD